MMKETIFLTSCVRDLAQAYSVFSTFISLQRKTETALDHTFVVLRKNNTYLDRYIEFVIISKAEI